MILLVISQAAQAAPRPIESDGALETGVVDDPEAMYDWDATARPPQDFWPAAWKQPQSLVSALRRPAVWFFRDIAVEVGGGRYRSYLSRFTYGNEAAPDGNDAFWLDGTLRISPREQVDFLARLLEGELDVASTHLAELHAASLLRESEECRLNGKTGGDDFNGPFESWLVGWSQCGYAAPTVFALWTRARRVSVRSVVSGRKRSSHC